MRRVRRFLLLLVCGAAVVLGGGAWWFAHQLRPVSASRRSVTIVIPRGASGARVARLLRRHGLIRSATVFLWYGSRQHDFDHLRAGTYRFSPSMSSPEILRRLARGQTGIEDRGVTIPEGFTVRQIADELVAHGILAKPRDFLLVVQSGRPQVSAPFALPRTGLEGYLFPDTYRFAPGAKPAAIAQEMVDTFARRFYVPNRAAIAGSGKPLHQIVTIASMIEREAEVDRDRPRISGVIENRLARRMPLQIDATVQYALPHHKARLLYSDLAVDSPYNTYRRRGLPPGPIANPGLPSLLAALMPEKNSFLYYVAAPDGSHRFSRTEAEHLKAKAEMHALRLREADGSSG